VRITQKAKSEEGRALENGTFYTVAGFRTDHAGRLTGIKLGNGAIIPPDFGHITHGYYTTSHGSQGETADRILLAEGAESLPAASREQFYVSVSRGRKSAKIYTDDKEALLERIHRTSHRLSATELMAGEGTARGKPWAETWDVDAHRNNRKRRLDKRRRLADLDREQRQAPETVRLIERAHEGKVTRGYGMDI
jgi:hypothetical protein